MSFLYLVTIFVLLGLWVGAFLLMKRFTNQTITNIIFASVIFLSYIACVVIVYVKVGFNDWNFQNVLPVANVSPFMFFMCPLFLVLPKSIKRYFGSLISLLVIGMILSPILSCVRCFVINYKFHLSFALDYFNHIILSLWGVYLIQSGQTSLKIKDNLIGGAIIVGVAITMMIINVIFDTAFFGLSLNGKHNIYNVVLVSNSYLSALIYFAGLSLVLIAGYFSQLGLFTLMKNKEKEQTI